MGLSRIIYTSRATSKLSLEQLEAIVTISSLRNSKRNITGALVYCEGVFLQLLEGEQSVIGERFIHISRDERHENVQLLSQRPISGRSFASWDMSMLHENEMRGNEKIKFGKITYLLNHDPDLEQLGETANQLLQEFKSSIEKQSTAAKSRQAA